MRKSLGALTLAAVLAAGLGGGLAVRAEPIPTGWLAENMVPVGYLDLGGRFAYKLTVKQKAGRWYLYSAYDEDIGPGGHPGAVVVIDVTDPANPRRLKTIEGPPNTEIAQVSLHGDLLITNMSRHMTPQLARGAAAKTTPKTPLDEGVLFWDISDPANPRQVGQWATQAFGTHRNSYPGGKYAYAAASRPGFVGRVLVILDVSDPSQPREVATWHQYGQKEGEARTEGQLLAGLHGPAQVSPDGAMLTIAYAPDVVNLDISDIAHPKLIGRLTLVPPFANVGSQSVHTVVPYWDRKLLYVSGEARAANCDEALTVQGMVDNKDPAHPILISIFPTPRPPAALGVKTFCDRPGRFGPHNISTEIHNPDVAKPGDLIHVAYFNAGLWVYDIQDPRLPSIVGYFIPADSPQPQFSMTGLSKAYIAQDTLTDARGYVYMVGSGGLYILRDAGALEGRTLGAAAPAAAPSPARP
ncbi:MAG: hypothetical protein JWP92_47 [Caulobacter sp.]|nr:hypothetical protein [Caulobacter sp.]